MLTRALHMAGGALDTNGFFALSDFGGPKFKSIKALSVAALTRTAIKTPPAWQQDYNILIGSIDALPVETMTTRLL